MYGTMVAAEFIGTYFVILTKALNRLTVTTVTSGGMGPESWSVMAVLTAMVYSLHGVSGVVFTPALTIAAGSCGRGAWVGHAWIFYLIAQVFAAIAGSLTFKSLSNGREIP